MEEKILSTLELNEVIAKKAGEDEAFRLALLSDPKLALEKELGMAFPEDTKVEVHVENIKVLHLIIPAGNADELTDDQLEGVAGGVAAKPDMRLAYGVPIHGRTGWKIPK